jgi:hypothetical protein
MQDLYITHLLPNPMGKDRTPTNLVTNEQLNGEWVQFENTSGKELLLDGVSIRHRTFNNQCAATGDEELTGFIGPMPAGHSIRLHTGHGQPFDDPRDPKLRHLFLNRWNFVWNNVCGDRAVLRVVAGEIDRAEYDRRPPEGVVLERVPGTNKLAVPVPAYTRRY